MPLVVPQIDDRSYQHILDEARARIPVHNPEWTNFNDSDPGITILQLFAFMTENLLYRSNLIPERNRLKFLSLLGVPMQAATSAKGIVTFSNERGPRQVNTLDENLELFAGQIPFRTQNGLDVLPIEARVYYKSELTGTRRTEIEELYTQLYASYEQELTSLTYYETKLLEPPVTGAACPMADLASADTIDGSLWLALLARPMDDVDLARQTIANKTLTLGILPALSDAARVLPPGRSLAEEGQSNLLFQMPRLPESGSLPAEPALRVAQYRTLPTHTSADVLAEPGLVQLTLPDSDGLRLWELEPLEQGVGDFPPSLEETDVQDRVITWIRIRLREAPGQLSARLSWVGINAALITQQTQVTAEYLGQGTGAPDQTVTLVNTPVIPESVILTVNGQAWQRVDDLMAAAPEVPVQSLRPAPGAGEAPTSLQESKVYTLDRESGEIRFGNGLHGARPGRGAIIQASYNFGGGRSGVVGIGRINKCPRLPAGVKVTNPLPTWGGDEAETVEEAERNISRYLQHRDRIVSQTDFEEITRRTPGVDLGRVQVLPLFHPSPELADVQSNGTVTVMVIPRYDLTQPDAPVPDGLFLDAVCQHLNPRRLITTEVHVRGPKYVPIWVSIGLDVVAGRDVAVVRKDVKEAVRKFLSPLTGGREEKGWPLEKAVEALEIWAVATRVEGVSKVNGVLLAKGTQEQKDRIEMDGLKLPRLVGLSVQPGDPQPLEDLRGDLPGEPPTGVTKVPVPVVPDVC